MKGGGNDVEMTTNDNDVFLNDYDGCLEDITGGWGVNFFLSIFRDTPHAHIQEHSYYKVFFSSFQQKVTNTHTARSARGNFFGWEQLVEGEGVWLLRTTDGGERERRKKKENMSRGGFPTQGTTPLVFLGGRQAVGQRTPEGIIMSTFSNKMCVVSPVKFGGGAHGTILIVWMGGGGAEASWGRKKMGEISFDHHLTTFFLTLQHALDGEES